MEEIKLAVDIAIAAGVWAGVGTLWVQSYRVWQRRKVENFAKALSSKPPSDWTPAERANISRQIPAP